MRSSSGGVFINDKFSRATAEGRLQDEGNWELLPTTVERGARLGSGAVVAGGVRKGQWRDANERLATERPAFRVAGRRVWR